MDDGCLTVTVEEVICKVGVQNRTIHCKGIEKNRTGAVPDSVVGYIDLSKTQFPFKNSTIALQSVSVRFNDNR